MACVVAVRSSLQRATTTNIAKTTIRPITTTRPLTTRPITTTNSSITNRRWMSTVIMRDIPNSFVACLRESKTESINLNEARAQHELYAMAMNENPAVATIVRLAADETCPDCVFVEDSAVVYDDLAIITRSGAPSRRNEAEPIAAALRDMNIRTEYMPAPATLDGGDVLIAGDDVFVGHSQRTNEQGYEFLCKTLGTSPRQPRCSFVTVTGALHLKSLVTYAGPELGFFVADVSGGRKVADALLRHYGKHKIQEPMMHFVPDLIAANTLRVGNTVYYAANWKNSREKFKDLAARFTQLKFVGLQSTEINKGDGALTCCSIVVG